MATLKLFPNESKKSKKTGKIPVYLRVTIAGRKAECKTNCLITGLDLQHWNPISQRVDLPKSITNIHLNAIEAEYDKVIAQNTLHINNMHPVKIIDAILQRKSKKETQNSIILDYVNRYNSSTIQKKASLSAGTKNNYNKAIKHFEKFMNLEKYSKITFVEFEFYHAKKFLDYLLNDNEKINKKGMKEESALGIVKKFRTIFDEAVENNLMPKNHFKALKIKFKPIEKPRFSIENVKSLYKLDQKNISKHEELCRDLILFSTFTGLAFTDTTQLEKSAIEKWSTGEIKLSRPRTKTSEQVELFLTNPAINLIEKYKCHPLVQTKNYILPTINNSSYNKTLKLIAIKAGINFKVTTHTGRHSFRQLLGEADVVEDAVIKRMMGHRRRDQIDAGYYKVTDSRLIEAKSKFNEYLEKHLKE